MAIQLSRRSRASEPVKGTLERSTHLRWNERRHGPSSRLRALGLRGFLPAVLVVLAMACAQPKADGFKEWASQPTPAIWKLDSDWAFILLDRGGRIDRRMTLRFTDEPAKTCVSGEWRKVEILSEEPARSAFWQGSPAYELKGRALVIGLTANLCDNDDEVRGELTDLGFTGVHESIHMLGSEKIGSAYGTPISDGRLEGSVSDRMRAKAPGVAWTVFHAADFDGDGSLDEAALGRKKGRVHVAVALSNEGGIDVVDFAISSGIQDAICSEPAVLSIEELPQPTEQIGMIEGMPDRRRAVGLRLSGGPCDAIHLFWNIDRNELNWWRL